VLFTCPCDKEARLAQFVCMLVVQVLYHQHSVFVSVPDSGMVVMWPHCDSVVTIMA
jgi:hypothetical protein